MGFIRQVKQEQTDHNQEPITHKIMYVSWKSCAMNSDDISFG